MLERVARLSDEIERMKGEERQQWIPVAERLPEEIIMFRKMIKALSVICHVRVLGKVTLVDKKGRRW